MTTRRAVGIVAARDALLVGVSLLLAVSSVAAPLQELTAGVLGGNGGPTAQEHPGDWRSRR